MRSSYLDVDRTHIDYLIETASPEAFSRQLDELRRWYFGWYRDARDLSCRVQLARRLQSLAGRFRSHGLIGIGRLADALRKLLSFRALRWSELDRLDENATRAITIVSLKYLYAAPGVGAASGRRPKTLRRLLEQSWSPQILSVPARLKSAPHGARSSAGARDSGWRRKELFNHPPAL